MEEDPEKFRTQLGFKPSEYQSDTLTTEPWISVAAEYTNTLVCGL